MASLPSRHSSHGNIPTSSPPLQTAPNSTNFAFLVHSQDSISTNSPPNIDNKPLVRQRRRRTSPEDHAILETEFWRNPRPNREARLQIVERVSLGEKEVHIWFQNRRQKVRRRGDSLQTSSTPPEAVITSIDAPPHTGQIDELKATELANANSNRISHDGPMSTGRAFQTCLPQPSHTYLNVKTDNSGDLERSLLSDSQTILEEAITEGYHSDCERASASSSVASSANTGGSSIDSNSSVEILLGESPRKTFGEKHGPTSLVDCSRRSSATHIDLCKAPCIRLSFDSSGGAGLLCASESTPSPPRSQPLAPTPFATRQKLRRSFSAIGISDFRSNIDSPPQDRQPDRFSKTSAQRDVRRAAVLPRLPSGHSRDSRAWTFWCDSATRDEQAEKAERDSNGNATSAISLLRSRSVAFQNGQHRNSAFLLLRQASGVDISLRDRRLKRLKTGSSARKLERSHTYSSGSSHNDWQFFEDTTSPKSAVAGRYLSPTSDSDKENREQNGMNPQSRQNHVGAKRSIQEVQDHRSVLRECHTVQYRSSARSAGLGLRISQNNAARCKINQRGTPSRRETMPEAPGVDAEVLNFMTVGISGAASDFSSSGAGADEDEDGLAAQRLLSLSQGNWQ